MLTDQDLSAIRQQHYPGPPASNAELAELESRLGVKLDPELTAFYRVFNGAKLFKPVAPPFEILPLHQIVRARVAIYGKDDDSRGPPFILAICDVEDGNYVGIDTSKTHGGFHTVVDIFHETFPEIAKPIAASFGEFLRRALDSGGCHFWIGADDEESADQKGGKQ
jgi:hypothetical protein